MRITSVQTTGTHRDAIKPGRPNQHFSNRRKRQHFDTPKRRKMDLRHFQNKSSVSRFLAQLSNLFSTDP